MSETSSKTGEVLHRMAQFDRESPEFGFHCPGCGYGHWFKTTGGSPRWELNGNIVKPTVYPSILVRGQFTCHLFMTDGRLQFLPDSTHPLAGQTVAMLTDDD